VNAWFINCQPINVGIRPRIEVFAVKANAALPNRKLAQSRPRSPVELVTTQAEIARGIN
jgi:hypothetical protein